LCWTSVVRFLCDLAIRLYFPELSNCGRLQRASALDYLALLESVKHFFRCFTIVS
jgi:hypothetical protein